MSENTIKLNIKSAALELFSTKGYEATGVRELSAMAGCSLPMMYYHYESKEKLLSDIVSVDFVNIMNNIFSKAIKTGNVRLFVNSFINDLLALSGPDKQAVQIAFRLHMGSPKHIALNKLILSYKFSKESQLKELLLSTWRTDKNIEVKTHLILDIIYHSSIAVLFTNRPVAVKQIESDVMFLLNN